MCVSAVMLTAGEHCSFANISLSISYVRFSNQFEIDIDLSEMSAPDDETFEGTDNEKAVEDKLDRLTGQMQQLTEEERKLKDVLKSIK